MSPNRPKPSLLERLEGPGLTKKTKPSSYSVSGSSPSIDMEPSLRQRLSSPSKAFYHHHQWHLINPTRTPSPSTSICLTTSTPSELMRDGEGNQLRLGNHLLENPPGVMSLTDSQNGMTMEISEGCPAEKKGITEKLEEKNQTMMEKGSPKGADRPSTSPSSPGALLRRLSGPPYLRGNRKSLGSLITGPTTQPLSSGKSYSLPDALTSRQISGSSSSRGSPLISTRSSEVITPPRLTRSKRRISEMFSNSPSNSLGKRSQCEPMENGLLRSPKPSKRSRTSYHPVGPNTLPGKCTSPNSSLPSNLPITNGSLNLTEQPGFEFPIRNTFASMILPNLRTCEPFSSPHMVWVPVPASEGEKGLGAGRRDPQGDGIPAIIGTGVPAASQRPSASTNTVATSATAVEITGDRTVRKLEQMNERIGEGPRHKRRLVWGTEWDARSKTVKWTETAAPLPRPPPREFDNTEAMQTIAANPHLFLVSTPINVDRFEALLSEHPNQPFVHSVCIGLREGFWPFADTHYGEWPTTWDYSSQAPKSQPERDFLRTQIEKEVAVGRYSPAFGPDLLPGMYSMPIHAVPKPGSDKLRLVTNHSASEFALNDMISRDDIAGVTLDNVQDLANGLRLYRENGGDSDDLIVWKADVSEAYRHMPMHPLWQIKQVVSFEGVRYIDWRNVFGGRASQRIFHAFMSLVTWIAVVKLLLTFLRIYVDDSFSFQKRHQLSWYEPYSKELPSDLARLLRLWDYLALPHEARKQVFATELPIIGFDVHPNLMRIRMSDESRSKLIQVLSEFAQHGTRRTLRDFQHVAGHLNWALNVYPLLRPGLCAVYRKTTGKLLQRALVWIN